SARFHSLLCLFRYRDLRHLHSLPTRRSSDLLVFAGSAAAAQRAEAAYQSARQVVMVTVVVAIALTLLLAWMLTRSIVGPLRQAMSASEVIATGDLTQRIEIAGRDEATRLLEALASMQGQLRDTI